MQDITIDAAYSSTQTTPNNNIVPYAVSDVTHLKAWPEVYKDLGIDMIRHADYSPPTDAISHAYQALLLGDHDN